MDSVTGVSQNHIRKPPTYTFFAPLNNSLKIRVRHFAWAFLVIFASDILHGHSWGGEHRQQIPIKSQIIDDLRVDGGFDSTFGEHVADLQQVGRIGFPAVADEHVVGAVVDGGSHRLTVFVLHRIE